jgi:hypothetical protein
VLRRTFGPKRDEIIGRWRKQHNEGLHNVYSLPNRIIKLRRKSWAGYVTCMGEHVYWVLVGKPERRSPLGRPRNRGVDNIKMDLWKIGLGGRDWILLP